MTLIKHELRQGKVTLMIWTAVIAFMLALCVLIYPEMETQMGDVSTMFAEMGSFSAAFGMDRLNFGEFMGFFGVECGNILGLGGAFFSALLGISVLSKEEREQTAEFLLTHPVSRRKIVMRKYISIMIQILFLNIAVIAVTLLSMQIIGESLDNRPLFLLFLAYYVLQVEVASVCFGISAFLSHGGMGVGLGMAALLYFLNIIANLTEDAKFLKYITPFGYTEGADIIADECLNMEYLSVGLVFTVIGISAGFYRYCKKDIL
ncbi:MAG: ABC transporter permease subunit [Dorea sp.]|jgi:ABC-2 type transport system permease protein|uniref:ABC transporter permease subunit n=1 Tax=Sporofaciens sp. JLR.KK001 TaxID=3112621 RepID=UPI0021723A2C|nr:ABC transporter permease subunit [Dorea sp.]